MKRLWILLFTLGLFVCGIALAGAAELRGLWVDSFHPGFRKPAQTTMMVARAKECHFNAIFVQVRRRGDVYYKSAIEPMAPDVEAGYDPLADIVKQAHAAGIQVHAWIAVYEVYHDTAEVKATPGQVHLAHASWLMKDEYGKTLFPGEKVYLDPGLPEVRQYLAGIAAEIAEKYEVDGIHLDLVRYPNPQSGYNEASVAKFRDETKSTGQPKPDDKAWGDWRRTQVTEFVRLTKEKLKQNSRPVKLSASVFGNTTDAYSNRFQDWPGWIKSGILDFAVPMVFATDNRVFSATVADDIKAGGAKNVYIGQGGWRLPAAKSVEQIGIARKAGAQGILLYNYCLCQEPVQGDSVSLMDTLKVGLFAK
jgi:uncharacterized lipoprotein YddW (UPF0748 family)